MPNSRYSLTPELPADMQRVQVSASIPADLALSELILLVNGQPKHTWSSAPYRTFWALEEGAFEFQLRGTLPEGKTIHSASVRIVVETSASDERSTP